MKKVKTPAKNQLAQLWVEEYINSKNGKCVFCDNIGRIYKDSQKFYCICPNGRALKKGNE